MCAAAIHEAREYMRIIDNKCIETLKRENAMEKRFISWNVNGIRACINKGFMNFFNEINADIFCLQEMKLSAGQC